MILSTEFYNQVASLYNKGTQYMAKNNYKKAYQYIKQSLDLHKFKEGYCNIGNCYRALGMDFKKAMWAYEQVLRPEIPYLEPPANTTKDTCQHALNNLGLGWYTLGDDEKAIKAYTVAVKKNPEFWEAWWNCSTAKLRQASSGRIELFPEAWEMYNARFLKSDPIRLKNTRENLVYWTPGEHVRSIIVLAEQGIGDNIMFGRYLARLKEYADKVYVQCDSTMYDVFSDYECVFDAADVDVDFAYPMCSLAACFPDIEPGEWLRGKFGTREFGEGYNVGIVWAGSAGHANNAYRSVPVGRFHRLAKYCNLYSLDPSFKGNKYVTSCGNRTWTDTAECINGLDLVIGVDTSVIHMAGSLGRETWLLQPLRETDFRWGNGVRRSVWYSSVEIYENPNDWEYVFDCVERDLAERVYAKDIT